MAAEEPPRDAMIIGSFTPETIPDDRARLNQHRASERARDDRAIGSVSPRADTGVWVRQGLGSRGYDRDVSSLELVGTWE